MNKADYFCMLCDGHAALLKLNPGGAPKSRKAFLAEYVFGFVTYDDLASDFFAAKALEVCAAISANSVNEYVADPDNKLWFLAMCNMPFFSERLNWGISIFGAWWDLCMPSKTQLESDGLWRDGQQITEPLKFSTDEWKVFIEAIIAFAWNE